MICRYLLFFAAVILSGTANANCSVEQLNVSNVEFGIASNIGSGSLPVKFLLSQSSEAPQQVGARRTRVELGTFVGEKLGKVDPNAGLLFVLSFLCRSPSEEVYTAYSFDYMYLPDGLSGRIYVPSPGDARYVMNDSVMPLNLSGWHKATKRADAILRPLIKDTIESWVELSERLYQHPPVEPITSGS